MSLTVVTSSSRAHQLHVVASEGRLDSEVKHLAPHALEAASREAQVVKEGSGVAALNRPGGVPRNGDVVGMTVTSGQVVGDYQVRLHFVENVPDSPNHSLCRGLIETGGVVVVGCTGHPRITVVEKPQVADAGHRHCVPKLLLAHSAQRFGGGEGQVADLSDVAVGGADQRQPVAPRDQHGQGSPHPESFVVRMSKYGEDGKAHSVRTSATASGRK